MVKQINVPGQGLINFPDHMSDDEISSAIQKNFKAPGAEAMPSPNTAQPPEGSRAIPSKKSGLDQLADYSAPEDLIRKAMTTKKTKEQLLNDVRTGAGYATMMLAPELKLSSMLPGAISKALPVLSGGTKAAKDILSSIIKTGASSYAGTKILPGSTDDEANQAGLMGAGITSALTPASMALASQNPLTRLVGGAITGLGAGYFGDQAIGGGAYTEGAGGLLGALAGLRKGGMRSLAANNIYGKLSPDEIAMAKAREEAAKKIGIDLTLPEKTGNPVLKRMQQQFADTNGGASVFHPFSVNRQIQEEGAYHDLVGAISPKNAKKEIETPAFERAKRSKNLVDVNPVAQLIEEKLSDYAPSSPVASALNKAKSQLAVTPRTLARQEETLAPIKKAKSDLQERINNLTGQLKENKPVPGKGYIHSSSHIEELNKKIEEEIEKSKSILNEVSEHEKMFRSQNNFGEYENSVRGLHSAKMSINSLIDSQGVNSLGNTASGELKQVNKLLNEKIRDASPRYEKANRISNLRQARQEIESKMKESQFSGSDFNQKILKNSDQYNELFDRLGNKENPSKLTESQVRLRAMRDTLPHLIDNMTEQSAAGVATSAPEIKGFAGLAKSVLGKVYMDKYSKSVAEIMTDPRWHDELVRISNIASKEDRGIKLGRLISKVAVTGVAANQQGSDGYGTRQ